MCGLDARRTFGALGLRQSRLAACLTGALGVCGFLETGVASTLIVNDCSDPLSKPAAGHVTLRSAVGAANTNATIDTIDASACSTITLALGEIGISASNLKILGQTKVNPGILTVDGNHNSRVFNHSGTGTVEFDNVTIVGGSVTYSGGGGILSAGSVVLRGSTVTDCTGGNGSGGGVFAQNNIRAYESVIGYNNARSGAGLYVSSGYALVNSSILDHNGAVYYCGGVAAATVNMTDSVVIGNLASDFMYGAGGGICAANIALTRTTVRGNSAVRNGGALTGIHLGGGFAGSPAFSITLIDSTIDHNSVLFDGTVIETAYLQATNSTISGNTFHNSAVSAATLTLRNSTVAFNEAAIQAPGHGIQTTHATIESSIVARNFPDDLFLTGSGQTISATHSLIMSANVPTGSLTADPQLTPLAFHGGATRTHALLATSPAIDQGSNSETLPYDQRGSGFAREVPAAGPDIGAYERQANDDEVFYSGDEP
jgi:hypothetical protein